MSVAAIDIARTTERLSAFLSEIANSEPVDNFFPKIPAIEKLMANKKMIDGGRQIQITIDSGDNPTVKDFSDYDKFETTSKDTVRTVVFPMVNKGGTITISWEEMREIAGKDHMIFDRVKNGRSNIIKTFMNQLDTDIFAATQVANKVTSLVTAVSASGSLGGLDTSADADWASTVTASGSFASQGLSDMRTLWNTLTDNGQEPNCIITTPTIYQFYEADVDPDVRYVKMDGKKTVGARGFAGGLTFNDVPLIRDLKCNSGVLYMFNNENVFFYVDTQGNFQIDDFQKPDDQKAFVATAVFRGQLVINRRKSLGKLTGITA